MRFTEPVYVAGEHAVERYGEDGNWTFCGRRIPVVGLQMREVGTGISCDGCSAALIRRGRLIDDDLRRLTEETK
jgi:hypothetical protein